MIREKKKPIFANFISHESLIKYFLGSPGEREGQEHGDDDRRGETRGRTRGASGQNRCRRRLCKQVRETRGRTRRTAGQNRCRRRLR
jgi:hypothetical protein